MNKTTKNLKKPKPFPGVSHKPRKTIPEPLTKTLKSKRFPKRYFGSLNKTKTSKYVKKMRKIFEESGYAPDQYSSFEQKSEITGIPVDILKECYNRGAAAWAVGGHRPGASESAWGHARVASLIVCGKAHYSADADLVRKAIEESPKAKKFWTDCNK
jgi:hypothetical protein